MASRRGPRIPRETLRRFWTMLAHDQGRSFNASTPARSLGLGGRTVGRYLDLMVDLLLVRRLPSWRRSARKRLVKTPRAYLRDSGVCHALLGIDSYDALLGHPVAGGSWEGFVIENILSGLPAHVASSYHRTTGGAGFDLVLELGGGRIRPARSNGVRHPGSRAASTSRATMSGPIAGSSCTEAMTATRCARASRRWR